MVSTYLVESCGMRHWNLTYNDPDRWAEVYAFSGPPLDLWTSLRSGFAGQSTGSPKFLLEDASDRELSSLIRQSSALKWANFQRTERGCILYFRVQLETYGIPFKKGHFSIQPLRNHGPHEFFLQVHDMLDDDWLLFKGPGDRMQKLDTWLRFSSDDA